MNVHDIAKEVIRLAQKSPDFIYESVSQSDCTYLRKHDGELVGDCIFGRALVNLGFDKSVLEKADKSLALGGGYTISSILVNNGVAEADNDDLLSVLDSVQEHQDNRVTWGEAINLLVNFMEKR